MKQQELPFSMLLGSSRTKAKPMASSKHSQKDLFIKSSHNFPNILLSCTNYALAFEQMM
jgi:hypothetical protein